MSFTKFLESFSSGSIFLIPIDDEYNPNNNSFHFRPKTRSRFNFSDTSSPNNSKPLCHSSSEIYETHTLQTYNIFQGNLKEKIQTLKAKTKEDYINILLTNSLKENKLVDVHYKHRY
jgi:hypothetical protein